MDEPIGLLERAIRLDRDESSPLFAQIGSAIERRIAAGELVRGMRLPAVRELALALGVNRATVGRAYRALEAKGLVSSRVGSGTVVLAGADGGAEGDAATAAAATEPVPAGPPAFSRGIREMANAVGAPPAGDAEGAVDFALMLPDVDLFPRRVLAAAVERALARGAEVLQYGAPAGLPSLRAALATRLVRNGLTASPDDVLVVNGIQQALDLLAKVLLEPGDAVVVESPTYSNVLPLLRFYGARTVPVRMDQDGIDVAALETALAAHRPKLLYTIPTFHNPTGTTMTRARRTALLAACRRHGTLVVEDGYEEDLRYGGESLPPLAALDRTGTAVVHLGTFSKGLFPGLRLGYLVARGELLSMLTLAKRYGDYHANLLSQAVLAEILERGEYDKHLDRLRKTYRARMEKTVKAMEAHLPRGVRFRAPQGGYTAWLELPEGVAASAVAEEARRRGVLVLAGRPFYDGGSEGERGLRISISRTDPRRIEEGMVVLGDVLREALARDGGARSKPGAPTLV